MSKVTVFGFQKYDINSDEFKKSSRLGTREAVEKLGGRVLGEAIEIDDAELTDGLTINNYGLFVAFSGMRG
jgi:hypothetical protein